VADACAANDLIDAGPYDAHLGPFLTEVASTVPPDVDHTDAGTPGRQHILPGGIGFVLG
jgi:hypothetical protein